MPAFIPDGYTQDAVVSETPHFEEVRFQYRPATASQVTAYQREHRNASGSQVGEVTAKFLADHLVSWSITHNGSAVQVTVSNCKRLHTTLSDRLVDIIAGMDNGDQSINLGEAKGN